MANEATATLWAAANALNVLVTDAILEFQARYPVIANLVRTYTQGAAMGKTTGVRRWPTLTVSSLTEGTDMGQVAGTPTAVQLTSAAKGISFEVVKMLEYSDVGVIDKLGAQGASATMQVLEDDLAALFAATNGGTAVGTSGSDLTLNNHLDAIATLLAAQAAGDAFCIYHPIQVADLIRSVGSAGGFAGTDSAKILDTYGSTRGLKGVIGGTPIFESPRCASVNTNADRSGIVMTADAISVVLKWGVTVESQKWVLGPSTYIGVTMAYGVGETADQFGVPVTTDHE